MRGFSISRMFLFHKCVTGFKVIELRNLEVMSTKIFLKLKAQIGSKYGGMNCEHVYVKHFKYYSSRKEIIT
jgi:hypothetical protein